MRKSSAAFAAIILFFPGHGLAQTQNSAKTSEERIVKARPFPMSSVRLTGGPLKNALDLNATYLLSLEPDRMLAFLRQRAGLQPKAEGYGGWDGPGRQLTGHIAGHYLSGVSLMYSATGDVRFKERADYIVKELKEIQDKQGDGYIGGLMDNQGVDGKVRFQDLAKGVIRGSNFDLNGLWSPWYVQHKLYAGLRDAYRHTGNRTALEVEVQFAAWAESILSKLDDAQIQKMLATEFGGMNEVAADLYRDTGDKRWLALADKFHHRAIVDELAAKRDVLPGKHGNTQVPKLLGTLMRYVYTGNQADADAARFFFDQVAQQHSFATGGHGKNEYFGQPGKLNNMVDGRTAETCNVYNMLKLARVLFSVEPDMRIADFYERALLNHILPSQDPQDGRVCYMLPVGRGVQHEYQDMQRSFTCCVGSSMESHALHAFGIYYESGNKLWVNLYAPSTAEWQAAGVKLEVKTDLPEGQSVSLKFAPKPSKRFTLALRRPYWAGEGFSAKINGKAIPNLPPPGTYLELNRNWRNGDTVDLVLHKALREEPLPDNPNRKALLWGELVLAADLGPEMERRRRAPDGSADLPAPPPPAPVFVAEKQPVEKWMKPVADKPGAFRTSGVGLSNEVEFVPFFKLPRRRYAIYWDMYTPADWQKTIEKEKAEQEQQKKIEAATVAFAQPAQFNQQGEDTSTVPAQGRFGLRGTKWFSFDVPVNPASPMILIVTLTNDARQKASFDILVEGTKVGEQAMERRSPEQEIRFFDVQYPLPADLVKGKRTITVRFQATGGNEISPVYGVRTIRADAAGR